MKAEVETLVLAALYFPRITGCSFDQWQFSGIDSITVDRLKESVMGAHSMQLFLPPAAGVGIEMGRRRTKVPNIHYGGG